MVTRIEDRTLFYRFYDRVKLLTEETKSQPKKMKDLFDYLFLARAPDEKLYDFECGGSGLNKEGEESTPIVLSNSIGLAEDERLKGVGPFEKRTGELLLCKVYLGNLVEHKEKSR